jgi:hypothetical protein
MARTISILVGREPRAFTRLVSDAVQVNDTRTVSLTQGPSGGGATRWGFSAGQKSGESYAQAYARATNLIGAPLAVRIFSSDGTLPWPIQGTFFNDKPQVYPVVSWKPPNIVTQANGGYDSVLRSWLDKVNRVTYFGDRHEPDAKIVDGGYTNAQYVAAAEHVFQVVRDHGNPLVRTTQIMANFNAATRWPPIKLDPSLVDAPAFDPYMTADRTQAAGVTKIRTGADVLTSMYPGKKLSIGEIGVGFGTNNVSATDAQRRAWIQGCLSVFLNEYEWEYILYWNGNDVGGSNLDDWPTTAAAWKAVAVAQNALVGA